jgi:photosystem II stability/assembly factor-like uncharacterized protein
VFHSLTEHGWKLLHKDELSTNAIDAHQTNESVVADLSRSYKAAVQATDGTHYALYFDGTDHVLYESNQNLREDSWAEIYRWPSIVTEYDKVDLHLTTGGTLLTAFDGDIKRSTDGGTTWTDVYTLNGGAQGIWTFTENSTGSILASQNHDTNLFQSTDDGATWTVFADGTDFPNFQTHVHKVRYHAVNDNIIVTGGDSGTVGWYRSTDGGTSWNFYQTSPAAQMVGITTHPTDGNIYYLFEDTVRLDAGIWRINDDGTTVTSTFVQKLNLDDTSGARGRSRHLRLMEHNHTICVRPMSRTSMKRGQRPTSLPRTGGCSVRQGQQRGR